MEIIDAAVHRYKRGKATQEKRAVVSVSGDMESVKGLGEALQKALPGLDTCIVPYQAGSHRCLALTIRPEDENSVCRVLDAVNNQM